MEKQLVVPGTRRPWALDKLPMLVGNREEIIDLDLKTHDAIIRSQYKNYREGNLDAESKAGDYTFKGGGFEAVRLFNQNNRPPFSFGDFCAQQLEWQVAAAGVEVKRYATIGTGPSADQALNAYHLFGGDTEIHIFEAEEAKLAGALYLMRKLGLGDVVGKNIKFHVGDATKTIPEIAAEEGPFDLIDGHLLLQHFRGAAFGDFLNALRFSVRKGGLLKFNDLMLGQFGGGADVDDDEAQKVGKVIKRYLVGDGAPHTPCFLNVGWRWPKGHAWDDTFGFVKDILECIGDTFSLRSDLEATFPRQRVDGKHSFLTGMRYLPPVLAAAMTARARGLRKKASEIDDSDIAQEAERAEMVEKWAWEEGEQFDEALTSPQCAEGHAWVEFPECVGIAFQKK